MTVSRPPFERVLITGAAGFIGMHTALRYLAAGARVLGIDNFNSYYEVSLKEARAAQLASHDAFAMARLDIADLKAFEAQWAAFQPDLVVHLAAQAGVRHSITHPGDYVASNLVGTFHVLDIARRHRPKHLLAASTSSVYGANTEMPFHEGQTTAHPLTVYAATKIGTEALGHAYANIDRIPITFFRFFTVYGPWGRPDMAPMKFARAMLAGEPIDIYNHGEMFRDFTYVDDLVESIVRLAQATPGDVGVANDSLSPVAPFRVVNIGQGAPVRLLDFVEALEQALGVTVDKRMMPMQPGEVLATDASAALLQALTGYTPSTSVHDGVKRFAAWYRAYRGL